MIQRRAFLAGTLTGLVAPLTPKAQQPDKVARIGVLSFGAPEPFREGFRRALVDLGYVEGRNVVIEHRWADGQTDRLPMLAAALVRANVNLIVAAATPSVQAAMEATRHIPIVMAAAGDALRTGLVTNLAPPGGNVTGRSPALIELVGKTVELLREALPRATRFACLVHREDPLHREFLAAAEHRLPSFSGEPLAAEAGMLITHGASIPDTCQRAAAFSDRILKGAKPADLPVEQPTRFELVINLRTARPLGLALPPAILLRADRVVE
jgi:putative ABC transport system substrate-binding protein